MAPSARVHQQQRQASASDPGRHCRGGDVGPTGTFAAASPRTYMEEHEPLTEWSDAQFVEAPVLRVHKATCHFLQKEHAEAKKSCAHVECGLKNLQESIRDCKHVVELDPQDKDSRALLKQSRTRSPKGSLQICAKPWERNPPQTRDSRRHHSEDDGDDSRFSTSKEDEFMAENIDTEKFCRRGSTNISSMHQLFETWKRQWKMHPDVLEAF